MITQSYKIDMTSGAVPIRIKVSQYDAGIRQLNFTLYNLGQLLTSSNISDLTAYVQGTKPDKKGFEYSCVAEYYPTGCNVTVQITEQMTACAGDVVCELVLVANDDRIGSANFILEVERAALGADTDISETELPDIITAGRQYAAAAEEAAEIAQDAAAGLNMYKGIIGKDTGVLVMSESPALTLTVGSSFDKDGKPFVVFTFGKSQGYMWTEGQNITLNVNDTGAFQCNLEGHGIMTTSNFTADNEKMYIARLQKSTSGLSTVYTWLISEVVPVDNALNQFSPHAVENRAVYAGLAAKQDDLDAEVDENKNVTFSGTITDGEGNRLRPDVYSAYRLLDDAPIMESTPYLFRKSGGVVRNVAIENLKKVIGASVAWNQHSQTTRAESTAHGLTYSITNGVCTISGTFSGTYGSQTLIGNESIKVGGANHKILLSGGTEKIGIRLQGLNQYEPVDSANGQRIINVSDGSSVYYDIVVKFFYNTNESVNASLKLQIIDLTQLFGTAIADYIYSLEQATAGSGIAKLKEWGFFTKDYYAYNTGALHSVKTSGKKCVGKNQLPNLYTSRSSAGIDYDVYDNGAVHVHGTATNISAFNLGTFDLNDNSYIINGCPSGGGSSTYELQVVTSANITYRDYGSGASFSANGLVTGQILVRNGVTIDEVFYPMIRFSTIADATFEPYTEKTYPLSDVELRGLYKLNNGVLYADGDEYTPDGNIKRKYGIVDLGSLEWDVDDTAVSGKRRFYAVLNNAQRSDLSNGVKSLCIYNILGSGGTYSASADGYTITADSKVYIFINAYSDYTLAQFTTAMSGKYLIYELTTPTTEDTTPYAESMIVYGDGTEKFIDARDVPVPVGHNSEYWRQVAKLPASPTTDGTYKLTCTVTDGKPVFNWTAEA